MHDSKQLQPIFVKHLYKQFITPFLFAYIMYYFMYIYLWVDAPDPPLRLRLNYTVRNSLRLLAQNKNLYQKQQMSPILVQ